MLSLTLLFTSLLASFAAAQNSTSSFNVQSVPLTMRNQWCQGETTNCPYLCGGPQNLKTNTCDGASLNYQCICKSTNAAPANIGDYSDTLPNHICQQEFANCRQENPGSQSCTTCGTETASTVKAAAATSSAAASSSAPPSSTTAGASAASPSASAKGSAGRLEGAVGGVAAGVIAAVLL